MDATPPHLARLALTGQRGPEGRLDRAFSRIAESDLRLGNGVRLLKDARENYPAWLKAIRGATEVIHFENFIIADDETGRTFAEALAERARAGVTVRVLYDWLGSSARALPPFWTKLERAGVEVRVFNPPRLTAPFWVRRDHRKLITVDGRRGFVSGLCVSDNWPGHDEVEPWRDTGLALEGPIVADLDEAFAEVWAQTGAPLPAHEIPDPDRIAPAGTVAARVIKGRPGAYRTYRLDQFVAATARRNLWLTDAYLVANTSYVQALAEAARDGVDVRLLVPGSSDVPMLQPIVRAGYRPLIEAGIRVFEWNGEMLHAKTAVADGRWARVGSSNLNPTSWATNWELDVVVEDEGFAAEMEAMYLADLANATEIVPGWRPRPAARKPAPKTGVPPRRRAVGRLAAGAIALGNTVGTAIAGSRSLAGTEVRSVATIGVLLLALAVLVTVFPVLVISPLVITLAWFGIALLARAYRLASVMRRSRKARAQEARPEAPGRGRHPAPAE
ncbi:MAG TPA: phospholipase D-like domain-containing protein [Microvirga sp.]|jgi:cardiolipin synthase|nr:phospholipase D-like domain-containing protein [Microvirga sp.]